MGFAPHQLPEMVYPSQILGAPTSRPFDYQRFLKCVRRALAADKGTEWHRNAPNGTESPEVIPKYVLQTFTVPKHPAARVVDDGGEA
jgi:hypothetical protein